jgi:hypothetical protein
MAEWYHSAKQKSTNYTPLNGHHYEQGITVHMNGSQSFAKGKPMQKSKPWFHEGSGGNVKLAQRLLLYFLSTKTKERLAVEQRLGRGR